MHDLRPEAKKYYKRSSYYNKQFPNRGFYMAGIIPVAEVSSEYKFPWHNSLMPVAPNIHAIERAVFECADAGCETIWIVCNDDVQPLLKKIIGEWIYDVYALRTEIKFRISFGKVKKIPIYYVPYYPSDRKKRSIIWSILHGINVAYDVSKNLSIWTVPDNYYITFPNAMYVYNLDKDLRIKISSSRFFYVEYNGKSIKDNLYLPFTISAYKAYDLKEKLKNIFKQKMDEEKINIFTDKELAFSFKDVFSFIFDETNEKIIVKHDIDWYYNILNWNEYTEFLNLHSIDILKYVDMRYKEEIKEE